MANDKANLKDSDAIHNPSVLPTFRGKLLRSIPRGAKSTISIEADCSAGIASSLCT